MESEKYSQSSVECSRNNRRDFLKLGACAGIGFALGQAGLSCSPQDTGSARDKLAGDEFAMVAYCCLECDKEIWTKWPELKKKTEEMRRRLRS